MRSLRGWGIAAAACACLSARAEGLADLPLLDLPYNTARGGSWPAMSQSLQLSDGFYAYAHHRIARQVGSDSPNARVWLTLGFDVLAEWLPLGNAWLHEEWHRAVMSQYGVSSFNDVYKFRLFADAIAVSHVTDADLIWLKKNHPADFVRLSASGFEAQYEQNLAKEMDQFFHGLPADNLFLLWSNAVNNYFYFRACAGGASITMTDKFNTEEGSDVARRDFTGLDCNAWVYDLFRPQEDYAARGLHPSGVGIDRYRSLRHLTPAEIQYLGTQRDWMLVNFIDPFLINRNFFTWQLDKRTLVWNANARHHAAPFGDNFGLNLFLSDGNSKSLCTFNLYRNYTHAWAGVDCRGFALPIIARPWRVDARIALWQQPQQLSFYANRGDWGGLLGARLGLRWNTVWEPYVEADVKSAGWVPGYVALNASSNARVGFIAHF